MASFDFGIPSFTFRDYNRRQPFAGFLPGIGGLWGVPGWAFYVNRGQGLCSFGLADKDHAMLEFLPANQAFQLTPLQGFRTFYRICQGSSRTDYEPFQAVPWPRHGSVEQTLEVAAHQLTLSDLHRELGLKTSVCYFPLVNDSHGGIVRSVEIRNVGRRELRLDILDGIPRIIPFGMDDESLKMRRYLMEAFITVQWLGRSVPLFGLPAQPRDTPETEPVQSRHFYLGFRETDGVAEIIKPIVDPESIFGTREDFSRPDRFWGGRTAGGITRGVEQNRFPCAFLRAGVSLRPSQSVVLNHILGTAPDADRLRDKLRVYARPGFVAAKMAENEALAGRLMQNTLTVSNDERFDGYCRQNYFDNLLRGGWPLACPGRRGGRTIYVYQRKHGDLERDYNAFRISPTYYSQGGGNYRDLNQNRRHDLYFLPAVGMDNLSRFLNLIQLDGYNPLVLKREQYSLTSGQAADVLRSCGLRRSAKLARLLRAPFFLGELLQQAEAEGCVPATKLEKFSAAVLARAAREELAEHGEGFWTDHWAYNIDLVESYLSLYPDKAGDLLARRDFTFFDNPYRVVPRRERYCRVRGEWQQLGSVRKDESKAAHAGSVRTRQGRGPVYRTGFLAKCLCVLVNKIATLDPSGIGVEMEADKPNWYDALNGLPSRFGSSVSETFELHRLCNLLERLLAQAGPRTPREFRLPVELWLFFRQMQRLLERTNRQRDTERMRMRYWEQANRFKEAYRERVRTGVDGAERTVTFLQMHSFLRACRKKLTLGEAKALDRRREIYRSYFTHQPRRAGGTASSFPDFRNSGPAFKRRTLPFFLEGNVHAMRVISPAQVRRLHRRVKNSDLYDKKLRMYKVNADLGGEDLRIGRARIFTPGWLENGSIWLHMEYKYLLELIRRGLHGEFYGEAKNLLVPFLKPDPYGRSIYENSSFLASSAHPDRNRHGRGFYARLTGSTAEFIHMWLLMSVGPEPFFVNGQGELNLVFRPGLASWLFTRRSRPVAYIVDGAVRRADIPAGSYAFLFLGRTLIVYRNPARKNTFGKNAGRIRSLALLSEDGALLTLEGDVVPAPYAARVREGRYQRIEVLIQ